MFAALGCQVTFQAYEYRVLIQDVVYLFCIYLIVLLLFTSIEFHN